MHSDHLIIFIKNPIRGKVKTRLAADIGAEKALDVYLQLVELTRKAALGVNCTRNVFYSESMDNDSWDEDRFNKFVQQGESLGERMKNAFDQVFALGAQKAVIIGSDCPELSSEIVADAFQVLDSKDVCIGPALDGGYYLIGMKRPLPFIFENKTWSTDSVLGATTQDLDSNKLNYGFLKPLSDLDTIDDLKRSNLSRYQ
jgi:rSAM/selenodomain-associated transferase 1